MKLAPVLALTLMLGACAQPDFMDTDGNGYRYTDLDGKWRVVNYWATWCAPCIQEIPELNALAAADPERLLVFGVNFDEPVGEEAIAQARKMKIAFPVYASDPAQVLGVTKPEVLPTTFIFGPDGTLQETLVGPQTHESLLAVLPDDLSRALH